MNQTNFNFIWKNRHHYLRKRDVLKSLEEGDLNVIDYEAMNGVVKLNGYRNSYKIVRASGLIFHLKYLINVEGLIFYQDVISVLLNFLLSCPNFMSRSSFIGK